MNQIAKLLLVDDHPLMRRGVRETLALQPGLTVVGEASDGAAALKLARELTPDLVILDVHLLDMYGIDAMRAILQELPETKVLMLSSDMSRPLVDEALEAGASGYLYKTSAAEELLPAVQSVLGGRLYLSSVLSAGILEDYRKNLQNPPSDKPTLTEEEKRLLRLIAEGRRNKEIASELRLSVKSVELHRSRLMKKTGCTSAAELVRYAIREKIVAP